MHRVKERTTGAPIFFLFSLSLSFFYTRECVRKTVSLYTVGKSIIEKARGEKEGRRFYLVSLHLYDTHYEIYMYLILNNIVFCERS